MHASEKWVQSQPARDTRRGPNTWSEKSLENDGCRALRFNIPVDGPVGGPYSE